MGRHSSHKRKSHGGGGGGGGAQNNSMASGGNKPPAVQRANSRFTQEMGLASARKTKEIRTSSVAARKYAAAPVDPNAPMREVTCPLLLRVFVSKQKHNDLSEYNIESSALPPFEVPIYTWKDATLRELASLVQSVIPEAQGPLAKLSVALVYPGPTGHYIMRNVGTVGFVEQDSDADSLEKIKFQTGDYMDIAIIRADYVPVAHASVSEPVVKSENI